MFPVKHRKFPGQAPITMRMMGLPGSSPLTTIGLHAMTIDRESMNFALNSTGYLTYNYHDTSPFIRYEALLLMLYKYYTQTRRVEGDVDSAFLRASAEMTATWRYKLPVTHQDVLASQKWVLEVVRHINTTPQEIKNVWGRLFDRFTSSLSEPAVEMDDIVEWWTAHYYGNSTEIPSYCLQLWMSKMLLPHMRRISADVSNLALAMLSPATDTQSLMNSINTAQASVRTMQDTDVTNWYSTLDPSSLVSWWELQCVACSTDAAKLHNSAIFLAVSAMGKTGSVTENWLENRRSRWGDAVRVTIEDDLLTGTQAIRAYFERNHPLESEIEGAYQFLASTYFAAKALDNQAIAWMIEQSRNHNISAAVAFATLILENDYISLTALMRKIPKIQFDNLLKVMLYAIQDPYANYIVPKVYSSQYKDLASIGTIYLNAANAASNRQHLTHKALDISRRAAIERELKRLIRAKGEAEASLYFDNTAAALREMGYARFHQDGDVVYLDPVTENQTVEPLGPNQDVGGYEELLRSRRAWPAEARSYSSRAVVVPYSQICERMVEHESNQAKAYKNILGAFNSACEQVSMTTIKLENNTYKFVSRVTPLTVQVRQWVLEYDPGYLIPSVQPSPIIEMAAQRTTEEYFRILFNPLVIARPGDTTSGVSGFPTFTAEVVAAATPDAGAVPPGPAVTVPAQGVPGMGPVLSGTAQPVQQSTRDIEQAIEPPLVPQRSYLVMRLNQDERASIMLNSGLMTVIKTLLISTPEPPTVETYSRIYSQLKWGPWLGDPGINDAKSLSLAFRVALRVIPVDGNIHRISNGALQTLSNLLKDVCSRLSVEWVDLILLIGDTVLKALRYKSDLLPTLYSADSIRTLNRSGGALEGDTPPNESNIMTSRLPSLPDELRIVGLSTLRKDMMEWSDRILTLYKLEVDRTFKGPAAISSVEEPADADNGAGATGLGGGQ